MTNRKKKWLIGLGIGAACLTVALLVTGYILARRFEPYVREQAISYLQKRFDSEVEIASLRVRLPRLSSFQVLFKGGRGALAGVEGDGILLRHKGRRDIPPMFRMEHFSFDVDLGVLFETKKIVHLVAIDGMEINIPPKGQRPDLDSDDAKAIEQEEAAKSEIFIGEVIVTNSSLNVLPKDPKKHTLHFDIHRLKLESAGKDVAMKFDASLTNAKPPGEIQSVGTFGPWVAGEPGDSPVAGEYHFDNADLGVFKVIAGILYSTGKFEGTLSAIDVKGEADVPKFQLKRKGNAVPLKTQFEVLVDGTNGNTTLKPVVGVLGTTKFTTSGTIIKHESDTHRTISLDVHMPKGHVRDLLLLAMKGVPFMEGEIALDAKIDIPPLIGKVREKLLLDGKFEITNGKFLRSKIQDQIDSLSRRGQGKPKDEEIDEVVSSMAGVFKLEDEVITFRSLSFAVPGSGVDLTGSYDLDRDILDFHGSLSLQAKVSQTMTGWKRWVLKPIDPFFSKHGAGTFVRIQVVGSAKEPKFGRDRSKKEEGN